MTRIGGLFFGYGGLDMAVQSVLGGELAWVSEIDKGACKIIDHRFPGVPNIGDVTKVDWSQVEPVDILTGGSPCQDLSHAGKRAGMTEGTRSNLWVAMREAIAQLRPSLVVWENVRGAASAEATSDLEFCPGCMGDAWYRGAVLRALGRVVGDLADLGYVGRIRGLRAADVGASHGRFRYFLAAHANDARRFEQRRPVAARPQLSSAEHAGSLLPTPTSSDTNGAGNHGDGGLDLRTAITLLPPPAVNDMGEGKTVEAWDEWTATMQAKHANGNGHGKSLSIEAQRLLPTPNTKDGTPARSEEKWLATKAEGHGCANLREEVLHGQQWGDYAPAIARWEALIRPAPPPTESGPKGNPRLSARFSEWLMGLPAGHITDVPGITRNEALKALGNGVVPQQAAAALRLMLGASEAAS